MSDAPRDLPRLVLDETSLRFDGLAVPDLSENIDLLADTLDDLGRTGHRVFVCPHVLYDTECLPGLTLGDFLFVAGGRHVSPDVSRRLYRQLDRCPSWTSYLDEVTGDVWVDEQELRLAFSVDYALVSGMHGRKVACIVFPACERRGPKAVRNHAGAAEVHFFGTALIVEFWRSLFLAEDVPESGFFGLAVTAFPNLLFAPRVSFGRFEGTYRTLRDQVVPVLGAINDHFAEALTNGHGVAHEVQALLGQYGLDVSPESRRTHVSPSLMKLRDVSYGGGVFRCEWHAKIERHRNRVHFTLPQTVLGNKILIGIFIEHLDT